MRIYISGPISDKEDLNRKAFKEVEELIRNKGHQPVNPHEVGKQIDGKSFDNLKDMYAEYMRLDIRALLDCQAIYLLRGWERSKGCLIEVDIANVLHMQFIYEGEL